MFPDCSDDGEARQSLIRNSEIETSDTNVMEKDTQARKPLELK